MKNDAASQGRSSPVRSLTKSPDSALVLSLALRERVEQTNQLPDALKDECLERLDTIAKAMPPDRKRRPSWIHDKNDEGFSSRPSRGRKAGRGTKDSGSRTESSSSERSGGERGGSLQSKMKARHNNTGEAGQLERTLPGRSTNISANNLLRSNGELPAYRRAKKPEPLPSDLFSVDFGSTEDARHQIVSGKVGRPPFLSPTASAVWKCSSKSSRPIPRAMSHQNIHDAAESTQPLQSTKSVPALHMAPHPGEVGDARRAVAAARDALAPMPNSYSDTSLALPVRGMGSLLRTSLRYALQT